MKFEKVVIDLYQNFPECDERSVNCLFCLMTAQNKIYVWLIIIKLEQILILKRLKAEKMVAFEKKTARSYIFIHLKLWLMEFSGGKSDLSEKWSVKIKIR